TKISEDGQSLLFSTVFGGTGSDYLYAMGMDSSGRIAITGTTASTDFPLLNPTQSVPAGNLDVYISFFEADGQSLLFSTYLGTSGIDHGRQIGFDSEGNVVIAGMIANGLLATDGAYQEEYGGGSSDAFVAKYTTNGTLEYFTFLGGEDLDTANDMAIDDNDNIVVTGYTISDNFPCLNAIQAEPVDRAEIFITKLTPNGKDLVFSTLLGGSAADYGNAIKVDSQGRILITGQTSSNDFPTTFPLNISESRYYDSLLVMLNQDGSLLFSTLFGGTRDDIGMGVAWHSNDTIVIFGYTDSPDFPVEDAYQGTHSGSNDMFIMKLNLAGMIDVPPAGLPFGVIEGVIIVGVVLIVLISVVFLRKRMGQ
ncbi:MAG: SBBP repeat-containing protein, partial [Candidatus Thorarchaeota archaeon]